MGSRIIIQLSALAASHDRLRRVIKRHDGKLVCAWCGGQYVEVKGGAQCCRCGALLSFSYSRDGKLATFADLLRTVTDLDIEGDEE